MSFGSDLDERIQLLRGIWLFSTCDDDELARIAAVAKPREVAADLDKRIEAGAVMVGDPEDCLRVAKVYESAGVDLLLMLVQVGAVPHEKVMQTIDLIGKHVMPKLSQSAKAFQQQSAAAS